MVREIGFTIAISYILYNNAAFIILAPNVSSIKVYIDYVSLLYNTGNSSCGGCWALTYIFREEYIRYNN